ncbi:hypothetical protein [Amycolatopsis sp. lyj-108]|uniref:hypothetical protein n=1 Tax=Amycolatopsis sp. lyj-108 TaxID=2789286 RepID=UPI003979E31F
MFGLLAIPIGLYVATRFAAFAADEADRRWIPLLALPIPRHRFVLAEITVTSVASLSLGAAGSALGWVPRAVAVFGALPVVGGFLLNVVLQSVEAPSWLTYLTPFGHLASVPAEPPNWCAIAILLVTAGLLVLAGLVGYSRRDLTT